MSENTGCAHDAREELVGTDGVFGCRLCVDDKMTRLQAERDRAVAALRKARGHTSYLPNADRDLLAGLLASIERIVDAVLRETEG